MTVEIEVVGDAGGGLVIEEAGVDGQEAEAITPTRRRHTIVRGTVVIVMAETISTGMRGTGAVEKRTEIGTGRGTGIGRDLRGPAPGTRWVDFLISCGCILLTSAHFRRSEVVAIERGTSMRTSERAAEARQISP